MEHARKMWIVIADGEHARWVSRSPGGGFHSDRVLHSPSAHVRSAALGDDRPGRGIESATGIPHAVAPKEDLHDREKRKFAEGLAQLINAEARRGAFDRFVLIAPIRTMTTVLDGLAPATLTKLVGTLRKDLTRVPDHELESHLDRWAQHDGLQDIGALDGVNPASREIS
jgi:protein required for attachment to host cells